MIIHRLVDVHSLFYFLPCLILPEYSMFWKVGFKKKTWYSHGFHWRILKDECVHVHATMLQPYTVTKITREKKHQPPLIPNKMGAHECCLPLLKQSRNTESKPHLTCPIVHTIKHMLTHWRSKHSSNTTIQNFLWILSCDKDVFNWFITLQKISISNKCCSFELSTQRILKKVSWLRKTAL